MIRNFWINLNEKYQRNKAVIWFIVAVVVLFILVMNNMDKVSKTIRGSSNTTTTSGSVSNDEKMAEIVSGSDDNYSEIYEKTKELHMSKEDCIKFFVQLCNSGKVDTAYEYLTDACKETLYPTKQSFIDAYYSVIFKISKECDITEVKNDTYRVKLLNDKIATGGKTVTEGETIEYMTVEPGWKISISGLIKCDKNEITSIAPMFTVYVDKTEVYMDHVVCNIRVKNNTMADIYINDADNSNIYIRDELDGVYPVDSTSMYDTDYLVSARSEKSIKLTFNINYAEHSNIKEMYFGNIKIVNKEFLDENNEITNPTTGETEYAKVKTNFPESYTWTVKFE